MWTEEALRQVIAHGETPTVELKVAPPRPAELAERLCGLANAQGGALIMGVEDGSLKIVGVPDARAAVDIVLRAARHIHPLLVLNPPEPEICSLDGKDLVVVGVPARRGPLYQSSGVFWIRRGTHTVPLTLDEVFELAHDRGLIRWELQPTRKATLQDIDLQRVQAYLRLRGALATQSSRFEEVENVLVGMNCATVTAHGEVLPTNAGLLFFGAHPQRFLPHSEVVCVLFRDEVGVGGYLDRKIITGTLQTLIDETELFLQKYIAVGARIEGWKRIDLPEYPMEALREAVVNAVVHRDYSREGESVRVFFYPDRIEAHNPGLLLPGISVELMARGEVISKLRNPTLAGLLRDVPGYMERIGSGVRFMIHEMRRLGLPDPHFQEASEFVVTFSATPTSASRGPSLAKEQQLVLDWETLGVVSSTGTIEQKQRITRAMEYVQRHGAITNREYREVTGATDTTALRDLEILLERGVLKAVGKGRARKYTLP
jgi:predicted HTH transcriptional regulator